ncbi:hypothetical protein M404DRAFT_28918 [Pisolithus tinctorius Marx 270]|uniref:Uncharacterized protein n=1 Tax=Pisolithus tinctorius Marx 270 TaxID=870435 RepID=A0A0C3P1H2_PISTI|nr:hypothetical protein M404DRAFT_28918 [Pisolithus tinctorius Marx 270]
MKAPDAATHPDKHVKWMMKDREASVQITLTLKDKPLSGVILKKKADDEKTPSSSEKKEKGVDKADLTVKVAQVDKDPALWLFMAGASPETNPSKWVVDLGASAHTYVLPAVVVCHI